MVYSNINNFVGTQVSGPFPLAVAITSPAGGASLAQGTPVTISGTVTGSVAVVQVKLGSTVLGSASIVGLTWSYSWTPQSGDVGAQTLSATATATNGSSANSTGIAITVTAPSFNGDFGALFTGVLHYHRSDLGLTKTGAIVNSWADQSGNGVTIAEASAGVGLGTATTGLNGHAGIAGGTGGQFGKYTKTYPAPGTTPTFFWVIARLLASPGAGQGWLLGDSSPVVTLFANAGANITSYDGVTALSATVSVNAWGRLEASYTNTTNDYVKFAASVSATGNPGNQPSSSQRALFARFDGGNPGNWEVLTIVAMNNVPSAPTLATASTAAQTFYTTAVGI